MINVNIRYKGKELSTVLPKSNNELNADLKKSGIDIPAEKLKLRSSPKDKYLVGLYTNNPLDDLIIDRLCNNDNLFELNNLCGVLDNVTDHDTIVKTILISDVRCINGIKKLFADRFIEFSDKLVLNTFLETKLTGFDVKRCIIEKAIAVRHKKFEDISRFPFSHEPLIAANKDIMYFDRKGNKYHCILIYDIDYGDGIVIEAEGNDYAQYAQYVPQAKTIYEQYRATHLNELRFCCPIEIYQHINWYGGKLKPDYNGKTVIETDICAFSIAEDELEKCRKTYEGKDAYSFYFGKYQIRSLYADCLDYRKNMAWDEDIFRATDEGAQQAAPEHKSPEAAYGKYSELFRLNDDVIRAVLFQCLLLDDLRIEGNTVFANLYTIYLLR